MKVFTLIIGVALLAAAGYFVHVYLNNRSPVVVQVTETPTLETPTPTPTPRPSPTASATSSPKPTPLTRLGYVRQQLLADGFDTAQVASILADARLKLYPITQVAYKEPDWIVIKQKLYDPAFVQKGKDYISANQAVFDSAEKDYGVPKEVLAGIIAIETEFGVSSGTTLTFNALYSRMEEWPATTWKAQADQLVALSTYCLKSRVDCFAIKGSYAGALGIVQFMPDSLLAYGVDGNQDGVVDLYNPADAIPSAANFLARHDWAADHVKALAGYYGSAVGYPEIVLNYASLLAGSAVY